MKLLNTALITLIAIFSSLSLAAEVKLNSQQITELLSGNTANGVHFQKKTTQYFSESGLTLWQSSGDAKPFEGQWKVENNQYCSDFGSGWNCYNIVKDEAQGIQYFIGKDFRVPFIMQKGYSSEI